MTTDEKAVAPAKAKSTKAKVPRKTSTASKANAPQPETAAPKPPAKTKKSKTEGATAAKNAAAKASKGAEDATANPKPTKKAARKRDGNAAEPAPEAPSAEPSAKAKGKRKATSNAKADQPALTNEPQEPKEAAQSAAKSPKKGKRKAATPAVEENDVQPMLSATPETAAEAELAPSAEASDDAPERSAFDVASKPPKKSKGKRKAPLPPTETSEAGSQAPERMSFEGGAPASPQEDELRSTPPEAPQDEAALQAPSAEAPAPEVPERMAFEANEHPRESARAEHADAKPPLEEQQPETDAEESEETASGEVLAALLPTRANVEVADNDLSEAQNVVYNAVARAGRAVSAEALHAGMTHQRAESLGGLKGISRALEHLVTKRFILRTNNKLYTLPEVSDLIRGRFQRTSAGYGFVVPDLGKGDYYVAPESTKDAWSGDRVLVRRESKKSQVVRRGGRTENNERASVVSIARRGHSQLVGTLQTLFGHPMLRPDERRVPHDIFLLPDEKLSEGSRVVAKLFWPEDTGEAEVFGRVEEVLGQADDAATETAAVIAKYNLSSEFSEAALAEAERIPLQIPASALEGRLDFRKANVFTVDGEDAKDFDDAIHVTTTERGTHMVGIHIADVSHYVQAGSALDQEAYERATSVYLPGVVLPMLPERLSNGVCSLVPGEDRLTLSSVVELDENADIVGIHVGPSVIHSKARLTYNQVEAFSEGGASLPQGAEHLEADVRQLLDITAKLREKRLSKGSIDFKMREVRVDFGQEGELELQPLAEDIARGMIEDLMLLANRVVARFLIKRKIPALFRIHEEPTQERFAEVSKALGRLGLAFSGDQPTPQAYQEVLANVRGNPREGAVNSLLLRSMQQAKYAAENLGHFGLAFDEYLHFTSPIRRYPDLVVHRVVRETLAGNLRDGNESNGKLAALLPGMAEHTSERERNAAEAERDLVKFYQAKWAEQHKGKRFSATVSGVVPSGLFLSLPNGIEGKLHISNLTDDYYAYFEDSNTLRGRSNRRSFKMGDELNVIISEVNPLARQIDFLLPHDHAPRRK